MKSIPKGTIFGFAALLIVVGYVAYQEFPVQTATATGTDKTFTHGIILKDTVANAEYTNNDPVSSSPSLSSITIYNWDDVKTLDKIAITAEATAEGYSSP